ncbi:4'-phosphopantetheinyl transferase family protein [Tenacibaculum finnmarkense]|uniref:4'-phosphopantetheinyl transferase superfamily protein n=1 Tax=Tenacibaculum finnmarkense genomovar finnmarkense TaxID=1458503 RepID=A0AAP1RD45_9FLAO|nr:4'-phosphopantetheinyl transferase superfamily protein [Tenacibaculum finnmarkense]MBE7652144.1 4'-phosphopantetheinyl transferase superfamily protein [Tenacibaculum finnmarkense genomovar finnmarkense]MBE7694141.1 4'-phosphopantetheinyl transferase superfamily protein [Tenacibaculum finnmarkense genomovar finnmarkense]MCD8426361.1 4'-phosphopantetheinyl transferase superfamily protein [Tenacibaculum finnmarkense genomovar finnmarkense]MCG8730153.1 4'-phosphopantetheinyl transferase superfam
MPVHKTLTVNSNTNVLIWKIEESFEELSENITLNNRSINRLNSMKSDLHRKGFLSVRQLLKQANYTDNDLIYDEFGKPHLKDGKFISITHSFIFSAIIISDDKPVGIDIEKQRDKIVKIAPKFTPIEQYKSIANHDALVNKLTIVWGAKESLYKIYGKKKLHFLKNIYIDDFSFETNQTLGRILYQGITDEYKIYFLETEGFTCVYAI